MINSLQRVDILQNPFKHALDEDSSSFWVWKQSRTLPTRAQATPRCKDATSTPSTPSKSLLLASLMFMDS
ncbi:hypothetical protein LR48_Vigan03g068100 [Vigna angularis]|uniref:Uncharacterized protein n=1 Tax=Phaseolus angularis TaxID=3914 RepID=A0A0L9U3D4_PHAAN|nr:hypothetical protein LR48_Vigan03g068100 [Vigna angularis]